MAKKGETVTKIIKLVQHKEELNQSNSEIYHNCFLLVMGVMLAVTTFVNAENLVLTEEFARHLSEEGFLTRLAARFQLGIPTGIGFLLSARGVIGLIKSAIKKLDTKPIVEDLEDDLGQVLVNSVEKTLKTPTTAIDSPRKGR